MILATFRKSNADVLDYDVSYEEWLDGDTLTSAVVAVTPDDSSLAATAVYTNATFVKVWLSGGSLGTVYTVTVTSTTNEGRVKSDSFRLKVVG